ncbi:MAG TPA: hypothetical protein VMD78_13855 [Candidatus Baltobacteraceae bacterium]|nr:hypothetical protein [Candidatus Baltobacteraceae bacterium]
MNAYNELPGGWLAPTPEPQPSARDEVIQRAMTEHLKFHSTDSLELFIWETLAVTGDQIYTYPISAVDAGVALEWAMRLHAGRRIQPSGNWRLLFPQGQYPLFVVIY